MTPSPLIDWSLLAHVVLVSLLAGVGVVVAFSLSLVGLSYARSDQRSRLSRVASATMTGVAGLAIVGALVWGLLLITMKS